MESRPPTSGTFLGKQAVAIGRTQRAQPRAVTLGSIAGRSPPVPSICLRAFPVQRGVALCSAARQIQSRRESPLRRKAAQGLLSIWLQSLQACAEKRAKLTARRAIILDSYCALRQSALPPRVATS